METTILQVHNIDAKEFLLKFEQLEKAISEIQKTIDKHEPKPETEYISRIDAAKMFGVSKVTIHFWVKKRILKAYKIANKVYFKRDEINQALTQIGGKK